MVVLNAIVSLVLLVIVLVGFPTVLIVMGKMLVDPFLQAQSRDRANSATSPAPRQRHLTLVKSTNAGDRPNAA